MIDYAMPGLYNHFILNTALLDLYHNHREMFYDNIDLNTVYGIFPFCIFDGGRIFTSYKQATVEEIEHILSTYYKFNMKIRLILTNSQLQEEHYYDRFGNIVLSLCEKEGNEIVCADDNFKDYIKTNYPKYSFISSTTKCLHKEDFLAELDKEDYKEVCLDYNLNHNFSLLNDLTQDQKDKCEFLVNAICPPGCPSRKEHYRLNGLHYLNYGKRFAVPKCSIEEGTLHPQTMSFRNNISYQEIVEKYEPKGFTHFKLEGRTLSFSEMIGNYVRYMIKPEYQYYVTHSLTQIIEKARNLS